MAIGMPIAALGSVPRLTLMMSPMRLIARRMTASQYPHWAPRHRPTAAEAQAAQAEHIRTTAHIPMLLSPSCARGLSRHRGSRKRPGKISDTKEMKLIAAPNKKNMLRAVMPGGRVSDLVVNSVVHSRVCRTRAVGWLSFPQSQRQRQMCSRHSPKNPSETLCDALYRVRRCDCSGT